MDAEDEREHTTMNHSLNKASRILFIRLYYIEYENNVKYNSYDAIYITDIYENMSLKQYTLSSS